MSDTKSSSRQCDHVLCTCEVGGESTVERNGGTYCSGHCAAAGSFSTELTDREHCGCGHSGCG